MTTDHASGSIRLALIGLPNAGKTSLFNHLSGERLHTSNFHGTTQEAQQACVRGCPSLILIDLPGIYALADQAPESQAVRAALAGGVHELDKPDAACIVIDLGNMTRGIRLLDEIRAAGVGTAVLLHDAGRQTNVEIDEASASQVLGVPTVLSSGADPTLLDRLEPAIRAAVRHGVAAEAVDTDVNGAVERDTVGNRTADERAAAIGKLVTRRAKGGQSDRADRVLLHPVLGTLVFVAVMWGLFWSVFKIAGYPMDWIDAGFGALAGWLGETLPAGAVSDLIANGIVGGVGATVIFVPQIAILFFLISLLEESGYLARGALLAGRLLRPFRLPGAAFVPLLSAHACAIPAIVACRSIRDVRERVATILVAPFMSCSARIPVYALLVSFLFVDSPSYQATAFVGCYLLGIVAALVTALVLRRSLLASPSSSMVIELPAWRVPSVVKAGKASAVRSGAFIRKAGTTILVMMIGLWWLSAYPVATPSAEVGALRNQAVAAAEAGDDARAESMHAEADKMYARETARQSFMGRIGRTVEPVFAPLGYDWQISIGVMTSFAAREVFVSTMSVVIAGVEEADEGGLASLQIARRDDGSRLFNQPTLWSLLVFYVLAMQCLPTLAVTAREAGGVKWALLQFGYMTVLAYVGALVAFVAASAIGGGA